MSTCPTTYPLYHSRYRNAQGEIDFHQIGIYHLQQRTVLTEELEQKELWPMGLVAYCNHELVQERLEDKQQRRALEFSTLLDFNRETMHIEHHFVNPVLLDIAYERIPVIFPKTMKHDALAIYMEEANHAHVADDLTDQISRAMKIRLLPSPSPAFHQRLSAIEKKVESKDRWLISFLFAVVTETSITGILSQVPRQPSVLTAVREVLHDHAIDEAKHASFFTAAFKILWSQLSARQKLAVGPLLPEMIHAFLHPNLSLVRTRLLGHGLDPIQTQKVIDEVYTTATVTDEIARSSASTISLMRRSGVLDFRQTYEAFQKAQLIDR